MAGTITESWWFKVPAYAIGAAAVIHYALKIPRPASPAPVVMKVFGFVATDGDPDASPFCTKLMTFLRMAKIEYDFVSLKEHMLQGAPKHKAPWVHWREINLGKPLGDSNIILEELTRTRSITIDDWLSDGDRALATAYRVMLEQSTYFGALYMRWATPEFWRCTCPYFFEEVAGFPFPLSVFIGYMAQWNTLRILWAQGIGQHTEAEIVQRTSEELAAVSKFLGTKKYFMGDKVSSIDATIYGFVSCMFHGKWEHPIRTFVLDECPNLVNYVDRMQLEFFPELAANRSAPAAAPSTSL